jgi:YD repeat-containing protein
MATLAWPVLCAGMDCRCTGVRMMHLRPFLSRRENPGTRTSRTHSLIFSAWLAVFVTSHAYAQGSTPSITSLNPASGGIGQVVTISGANFGASQGTSTVTFNGTVATVTSWTDTSIAAKVPTGAATGAVVVTVNAVASNSSTFTVTGSGYVSYAYDELERLISVTNPQGESAAYHYDAVGNPLSITRSAASGSAKIISFSPQAGAVGATVTIAGTLFSATASQNSISFNGTAAAVVSATPTRLITTVPAGASTGPITVTSPAGTAVSAASFTVVMSTAPTITSFSPTMGVAGTTVTINGTNFDPVLANDYAHFNISRTAVNTAASTTLTASVPSVATSGHLKVTTPNGTGTSADDFFVPPAPHTVADVAYAGRMAIGGARSVALTTAGKIGLIVFDGLAGHRVSASITRTSGGSFGCYWYLKILNPDGTVLGSTYACSGTSLFLDAVTTATTGTYTLVIEPTGTQTGTVDATIYDATEVTGPISTDGTAVTVSLTNPGQNGRLTFNGTAGQQVSASITRTSGVFTCSWWLKILKADGTQLASVQGCAGTTLFLDTVTLPATATYTLLIDPSDTLVGTVNAAVYTAPDVTGSIATNGTPVTVALTNPGQNGRLTFNGTAGQQVSASITRTSGVFTCSWWLKILKADGTQLGSVQGCSGTSVFLDTVTLPATATYTLLIDPSDMLLGTVNAAVYNVTDVTGSIATDGTPVTVPVSTPGQNGRLTFSGTAGQQVSASITRTSGTYDCSWWLKILKADGTQLASVQACGGTSLFLDTVTLPATSTYTLLIDPSGMLLGTVNAAVYTVNDVTGPIATDGTSATVAVTTPGQNGRLTFSGTAGQQVSASITRTSGTYDCSWWLKILKADGTQLASVQACGGTSLFLDTVTLPATSTYTLLIDPSGMLLGTVTAAVYTVNDVTGPIATDGTPVTVALTTPGQNGRLTFSGAAGQQVSASITRTTGTFACSWYLKLLKPDGTQLASAQTCGGTSLSLPAQTLGTTGTYTVLIDPTGMEIGTVSASVTASP